MRKYFVALLFFTLGVLSAFASQETNAIACVVKGISIPIKIMTPSQRKGPFPVVYDVHGGGWNGGTATEVPPPGFPPDSKILCDKLGIVYVGLAYRCKAEGTFQDALDDLRASIAWFESRADQFQADTNRVGFSGGSAGTPLSALLAEEMPACKTYVGLFGVYDFLNNTNSLFPEAEAYKIYGLETPEAKRAASAYYHLREHPPATLLFHGAHDILINPQQSVRFGEKLKAQGAPVEVTIYPNANHGYYSPRNPEEFKDSTLKIARLYSQYLTQTAFDSASLAVELDRMLARYFPIAEIPPEAVVGIWKGKRDQLEFLADGTGKSTHLRGRTKPFTYEISGGSINVTMDQVTTKYFMQKDQRAIYFIYQDGRFAGRKEPFGKGTVLDE
jgi:acetyl esterase/lipase